MDLNRAVYQAQWAWINSGANRLEIQKLFSSNAAGGSIGRRGTAWEKFDLIFIPGANQQPRALLVVPREQSVRNARFAIIHEDSRYDVLPMRRFRETLALLETSDSKTPGEP